MPKTSILIVTHQKDFVWLEHCIRSIGKFASGFDEVVLMLPDNSAYPMFLFRIRTVPNLRIQVGHEWEGNGMMWHMWQKMIADQICPKADFILHMDADCIFSDPVTPEDYFVNGKPVLLFARYDWIVQRFNNQTFRHWQQNVQWCLGGRSDMEFMRRHPAVHYRELYPLARQKIEEFTGKPCVQYMQECHSSFPQNFAEFPTLGEVAWRHFHDRYHWVNQETHGRPHDKLIEFWSHSPIDKHQELTWTDHPERRFVPIEVIRRVLA